MKILVTGGAGFIGSHLCERLIQLGYRVWAVDNLDEFYPVNFKLHNLQWLNQYPNDFRFTKLDILDFSALRQLCEQNRFDVIFHLAAKAGVRPSLDSPAVYQRVNVEGTTNVLEAARVSGTKKIIIASSSSVYGIGASPPFSESEPIRTPISPYAASKIACEALAHVYHHVYGMTIVALRYFTVYGPRQRPDLAIHKFARLIWSGKPIPVFGDLEKTSRDYTYIDDIINGTVASLNLHEGFYVINLGRSDTVPLGRLIRLLEDALGKRAILKQLPPQPGDLPTTYADITRAKSLLGFNPTVSIQKGISLFAEWFVHTGTKLWEETGGILR